MGHLAVRVGAKIRDLREFHDLSQDELGTAAGVTRVTISQIEQGKTETNLGVIESVSKQLDVDPIELFGGKPPAWVKIPVAYLERLTRLTPDQLEIVMNVVAGFEEDALVRPEPVQNPRKKL